LNISDESLTDHVEEATHATRDAGSAPLRAVILAWRLGRHRLRPCHVDHRRPCRRGARRCSVVAGDDHCAHNGSEPHCACGAAILEVSVIDSSLMFKASRPESRSFFSGAGRLRGGSSRTARAMARI